MQAGQLGARRDRAHGLGELELQRLARGDRQEVRLEMSARRGQRQVQALCLAREPRNRARSLDHDLDRESLVRRDLPVRPNLISGQVDGDGGVSLAAIRPDARDRSTPERECDLRQRDRVSAQACLRTLQRDRDRRRRADQDDDDAECKIWPPPP